MTSLENWSPVLIQSMWCTDLYQQPLYLANPGMAIYFIMFILLGEKLTNNCLYRNDIMLISPLTILRNIQRTLPPTYSHRCLPDV